MWHCKVVYTDSLEEFLQQNVPTWVRMPDGFEYPTPLQVLPYGGNDECVIVIWEGERL